MNGKILYLVIPCYNEQDVIYETTNQLAEKLNTMIQNCLISKKSKIVFVNDGSKDNTWNIICDLNKKNSMISGINLAGNKGHQNALLAGLLTVKEDADITITLDADLQDDVTKIEEFVKKCYEGYDIVCGVRSSRNTDAFLKRFTAESFYKVMKWLGIDIIYNHADYRLLSKRVLYELENFKEVNLFLRGIIPLIGFKSSTISYERNKRFAGDSKYPLKKMISFALDGMTSFSIKPIRMVTLLGLVIFTISILLLIYFLAIHSTGEAVLGWTTIVISVWGIGGLQLLAIGIIGEYIGKIYLETKARPRYIVEEYLK